MVTYDSYVTRAQVNLGNAGYLGFIDYKWFNLELAARVLSFLGTAS